MKDLQQEGQAPGASELTSSSSVSGVENDVTYSSSDTTYGTENESPKEVHNGDETCHDNQELQIPDARKWSPKYKLFVSFSAIISYFFM